MELIIAMAVSAGIPSIVMGFLIRRLEKKIDVKENARVEHETLLMTGVEASIALGEATAKAVQRIPDAHCNGDMHDALDYATEVKHRMREFQKSQTARVVI